MKTTHCKNITKVGVILRPDSPELKSPFENLCDIFRANEIQARLDSTSAKSLHTNGENFADLIAWADILLSIGGDGTLLATIRECYGKNIPCMGINAGRLGFLTAMNPNEFAHFIPKLKTGEYEIKEHLILECEIIREGEKPKIFYAFNEFFISKQSISGIIDITAKIEGELFNTYFCDALIIATPTGSTAYNISVGGCVVYPYCKNILLTPIAAHSLTQRPLIIDSQMRLEFSVKSPATLLCDGQQSHTLLPQDRIFIHSSKHSALLIYPKERNYFQILREKFKWGEL
ncbi:NAD(+)/NADH kinase [Helicobacter sp. 23-1048]